MSEKQYPTVELIDGIVDANLVPNLAGPADGHPPGSCPLSDKYYPNGSKVPYGGRILTCKNGVWV